MIWVKVQRGVLSFTLGLYRGLNLTRTLAVQPSWISKTEKWMIE